MTMQLIKNDLDPHDYDVVLADGLYDEKDGWYDLTFKQALDEQLRGSSLLWCKYVLDMSGPSKRLVEFLGYTDERVIFHITGIGVMDTLLDSLPRHPPRLERFTI